MRLVAVLLAGVLNVVLLACGQDEEVAPRDTSTAIGSPTPSASETTTPVVELPSLTPVAGLGPTIPPHLPTPLGDTSRIYMAIDGPASAAPGENATYLLFYEVRNLGNTGVIISFPEYINYASSRLVTGTGQIVAEPARDGQLRWALNQGTGILEVTFHVLQNTGAPNFTVGAYEPGTETTQSNTVTTIITP